MTSSQSAAAQILSLATPLATVADLDPLVGLAPTSRFVCIGDASHGTHEYYRWRARCSAGA